MSTQEIKKLTFSFFIAVLTVNCAKTLYPSRWQVAPVVADGNISEWSVPLQYYDNDTRLNYALSNDAKNLYVCIRATDDRTQIRMLRAGFTVWLDPEGKKNKATGITYPLPQSLIKKRSELPNDEKQKPDIARLRQKFKEEQTQMQLTGFKGTNGFSSLNNKEGIGVAINWDSSGTMLYEAVIPFNTFFKETISGSDTVKAWTVGLELHAVQMQRGGGMRGGGIGIGGGMGGVSIGTRLPYGGRRGGGGGDFSEAKDLWSTIRLSLKQ
jgi:hypothetical protein